MKPLLRLYLPVWILLSCILCGCSMQKRRYRSGFFLDDLYHTSAAKKATRAPEEKIRVPELKKEIPGMTAAMAPVHERKESICDTLCKADGERMIVKVTRAYSNKTFYMLCDSDDETEYQIETPALLKIVYSSGRVDSLRGLTAAPESMYKPYREAKNRVVYVDEEDDENVRKELVNTTFILVGSFFCAPLFIYAFIRANRLRKRLKEEEYVWEFQKARLMTIIAGFFAAFFILMSILVIVLIAMI